MIILWKFFVPQFKFSGILSAFFIECLKTPASLIFSSKHELPIKSKTEEKKSKSTKIQNLIAKNILFLIICSLFFLFNFYETIKIIQSTWQTSKLVDLINYPIFFNMIFKMIEKDNNGYYYDLSFKYNAEKLLKIFYCVVFFFMGIFDYRNPKYFVLQGILQQYTARIIYFLLFSHLIWIFRNKKRYFQKNEFIKKPKTMVYDDMLINLKLPILVYLFFLNDEMDRVIFVFIIVPLVIKINKNNLIIFSLKHYKNYIINLMM